MRISSLSFYNSTLVGIQDQQSSIARLSQQIATEKKYLAAKDAPLDAAAAMQLADKISVRTQLQANQLKADITLKEENTVLDQLDDLLASAQGILAGTSASQDQTDRGVMASQLNGLYDQIKQQANHRDSQGNYIFAGYQTDTQPYSHDSVYDGAIPPQATVYVGDAGQRRVEIDGGRYVATNDNLDSVMASGLAGDLLSSLDALAAGLRDGTAVQADIDNTLATVSSALDNLRAIQADVAGRLGAVSQSADSVRTFLLADQDAMGKINELDKAAAIVELQQRQIALQAAESSFGLTSKQSLFNYL